MLKLVQSGMSEWLKGTHIKLLFFNNFFIYGGKVFTVIEGEMTTTTTMTGKKVEADGGKSMESIKTILQQKTIFRGKFSIPSGTFF